MSEIKKVIVFSAGGSASTEVDVIPGEDAGQLITLAAPKLGFPAEGSYILLGPDNKTVTGDIYKALKDGDKLTLARAETGG